MPNFLLYLTFGLCIASIAARDCSIRSYSADVPFGYAQQVYWDNRTDSVFFAEVGAAKGTESIYRFDWNSGKLYKAKIKNPGKLKNPDTPVSFVIPVESSPNILIVGQGQSILRIKWDGVSREAKLLEIVATLCSDGENLVDRGTTSPDGTLFISVLPATYCKKSDDYPKSSVVYLKLGSKCNSLRSAAKPGRYTNGIYFDSKTDTCYIADDCSVTVLATKWNRKSNQLVSPNPVFKFDQDTARTNYPTGLTVDENSNFYVGDHKSGLIYYVNSKTGKLIRQYKVPATHITSLGFCGKDLKYLCVLTGTEYHDSFGGSKSTSSNPGDGKLYVIPITRKCCNNGGRGHPGVPVCGF